MAVWVRCKNINQAVLGWALFVGLFGQPGLSRFGYSWSLSGGALHCLSCAECCGMVDFQDRGVIWKIYSLLSFVLPQDQNQTFLGRWNFHQVSFNLRLSSRSRQHIPPPLKNSTRFIISSQINSWLSIPFYSALHKTRFTVREFLSLEMLHLRDRYIHLLFPKNL